jgi:putative salt-induced outer membrane protein
MRVSPALLLAPLLLANGVPDMPDAATATVMSDQKAPIPDPLKAMLDAAMAAGNDNDVSTIAKYAKNAAPDSAKTIDKQVTAWREQRAAAALAKIHDAGVFDLWKGKVQLGGYMTTGNTHDTGLSAAIDLSRESVRWRQKLHAQADYQKSAGIVTREHYLFDYEPNYKYSDRGYAYGQAQYESDHFLGFDDRYSASVGAGYSAIKRPAMTLNLELGPAYRDTHYVDGSVESSIAARGSVDFGWKLTPTISITQNASAYLQHYNSTVTSTSALNAKLIGPLAAQFSYNVQYESVPPLGSVSTDTTSRASLIYSF